MAADNERLEGDALYLWAKLITEAELIRRSIQDFGRQELERRGYSPDEKVINNAGYIQTRPNPIAAWMRSGPGDHSSARRVGAGASLSDGDGESEATSDGSV
jgi:hypothetical protein